VRFRTKLYQAIALNTSYALEDVYQMYIERIEAQKDYWQQAVRYRKLTKQKKILELRFYLAGLISSKLLQFWPNEEQSLPWQYSHILHFPNSYCKSCRRKFCFQCGEATWHWSNTCEDHLEKRVRRLQLRKMATLDATAETLIWKIQNSKRCPNCHVFIYRDEGCHKVACLYCGYKFCWICRSSWSNTCAFFKCGNRDNRDISSSASESQVWNQDASSTLSENHVTELGVPNVHHIRQWLTS
jgi:hypothetical protein